MRVQDDEVNAMTAKTTVTKSGELLMRKPKALRMRNSRAVLLAIMVFAGAAPSGAQTAEPLPMGSPAATILPHIAITVDALAGLPRRTVTVTLEDGRSAAYSGVDLDALLAKNGAPHGSGLRGKAGADYVVVTATDGYRVVFALAELDAFLTDKTVLLADSLDGAPLDARSGPFQIVVPGEKHHLRWVRNVTEIDVLAAP